MTGVVSRSHRILMFRFINFGMDHEVDRSELEEIERWREDGTIVFEADE